MRSARTMHVPFCTLVSSAAARNLERSHRQRPLERFLIFALKRLSAAARHYPVMGHVAPFSTSSPCHMVAVEVVLSYLRSRVTFSVSAHVVNHSIRVSISRITLESQPPLITATLVASLTPRPVLHMLSHGALDVT